MFTEAADQDKEGCAVDAIRYESEYGYIDSYEVLCDGNPSGGHYVACFEPDATDVQACDAIPE